VYFKRGGKRKMDVRELRNCFGQFATGVTVITWKDDEGENCGVTVNSFTSVSLEPALALVSIAKNTNSCNALQDRSFVINILSSSQEAVAWQFAGRSNPDLLIEWDEDSPCGPRLKDAVATIACAPWSQYDGGDHVLFVGEVKTFAYDSEADSLMFFRGKFLKDEKNGVVTN
jgi:flavin reductase (DIM6/NTAB) family NADH-FMN oxidoreductase RutF